MGPADHIRTKHEVKAFVEIGDLLAAEKLLESAQLRRELNHKAVLKIAQQHGQRMSQ
jgi:hypothetical protein